ncbi:TPA: hypothetical protein ACXJMU_003488 [Acinetobacter baumannii]
MGEVGSGAVRLTYVRRGVLGYINKNVARSFDFYISCRSKEWQGRRLIETHNSLAHSVGYSESFRIYKYTFLEHSYISYSRKCRRGSLGFLEILLMYLSNRHKSYRISSPFRVFRIFHLKMTLFISFA